MERTRCKGHSECDRARWVMVMSTRPIGAAVAYTVCCGTAQHVTRPMRVRHLPHQRPRGKAAYTKPREQGASGIETIRDTSIQQVAMPAHAESSEIFAGRLLIESGERR